MAGTVEAVGERVTRLRPGDEVYGEWPGSFAEVLLAPETALDGKPANLTFAQAGTMPIAGITALQGVRDHADAAPGRQILVNGASGGVGHFAVQIAKALGAEVTGVASGKNAEMVRTLGADHVIDYAAEDFTEGRHRYDAILDLVGNHAPAQCRQALTPTGTLDPFLCWQQPWVGPMGRILAAALRHRSAARRPDVQRPHQSRRPRVLRELAEAGKLTPYMDRTFSLAEAADAMRYLESGQHRGKVAITI